MKFDTIEDFSVLRIREEISIERTMKEIKRRNKAMETLREIKGYGKDSLSYIHREFIELNPTLKRRKERNMPRHKTLML